MLPGTSRLPSPTVARSKESARIICLSKRPVLYIGGGVIKARAWQELADLVELTGIPVVTTLMARGALPDAHPLNMGMPGMHGAVSAVGALQKSGLLIAVGTRFDDRVTGRLDSFAPDAKIIHADIDPAEIGKNRVVDVPVVGDAKAFLGGLVRVLAAREAGARIHRMDAILGRPETALPARLDRAPRRQTQPAARHPANRPDRRP